MNRKTIRQADRQITDRYKKTCMKQPAYKARHKTIPMSKSRRTFSAEFKARVGLEASRGAKSVNEIASENEVHPVQVSQWKKELLGGAAGLFERGDAKVRKAAEVAERDRAALERKVGQLTLEVDWLKKKSRELGL